MKTSSLKRKDQTSFGFVYASILIKYNKISLQGVPLRSTREKTEFLTLVKEIPDLQQRLV
jgi:hypothetical protein